jgi:hypothetical protein
MGFGGRLSKRLFRTTIGPLQARPYYHDRGKNQNTFALRLIARRGQWTNRRSEDIIAGFSLITARPLGMFGKDVNR